MPTQVLLCLSLSLKVDFCVDMQKSGCSLILKFPRKNEVITSDRFQKLLPSTQKLNRKDLILELFCGHNCTGQEAQ